MTSGADRIIKTVDAFDRERREQVLPWVEHFIGHATARSRGIHFSNAGRLEAYRWFLTEIGVPPEQIRVRHVLPRGSTTPVGQARATLATDLALPLDAVTVNTLSAYSNSKNGRHFVRVTHPPKEETRPPLRCYGFTFAMYLIAIRYDRVPRTESMGGLRRSYSADLEKNAIRRLTGAGEPISVVARDMNIPARTLYRSFSLSELQQASAAPAGLGTLLFQGLYPPSHDRGLAPARWYAGYVATFVERDVRQLVNVTDLDRFQLFLRLCAGRSGQLLNLSALGNDCGVSHNTARAWLSILETLYVVHRLTPHHRNFRKRLVKTPKLYFVDPGLLTYLLEIDGPRALTTHAARGAVFETWVVSELRKARLNQGLPPRLHFWRDHVGHEVDVLAGALDRPTAIEVKAGATVSPDYFKGLAYWSRLSGCDPAESWVVYGGDEDQPRSQGRVLGWRHIGTLAARCRQE